ncbi:efflux RND transporter permease subunit [Agaribacterium haliotis]|uniref:efflux RND transporter permease subunit n=1 Tax=Agaribacterium haliotis TaxID=2013869 RepID=UPI000BB56005|nr:efflux RND transporter permease subunit [Agaribacterium haliotis]
MKAFVSWFAKNPIAANILMLSLLIGGYLGWGNIKKEVFPTSEPQIINVNMTYLGASPSEVEQQIVVRIEEAIADIPGIFQLTSESRQSSAYVRVEVIDGYDIREVLNNVKTRVDAINTFPPSAERAIVSQQVTRNEFFFFNIHGQASPQQYKKLAYKVRDEMPLLEGISQVDVQGLIADEVALEVSEYTLRKYNLTFSEIAQAVRASSLNVPAGNIRSEHGDIQIQTRAQAYNGDDFFNIVVRSFNDGTQLRLGEIATIKDGLAEVNAEFFFEDDFGLNFIVRISDDPKLFEGHANAQNYIDELAKNLPHGLKLEQSLAFKDLFDSRYQLLKDNAVSGLILVFLILMLFLRPKLAMWVVVGIVTAFSGALWILPHMDVSINMLSMFAFLMVLGIVVDDAIIVGESIYDKQHRGLKGTESAIVGTKNVLSPVILAVLSTIIFFLPMLDVPKESLPFTISIFYVVTFCLLFSLVESLLILPAHLAHMKPEKPSRFKALRALELTRAKFSGAMENFSNTSYKRALELALHHKASTIIAFVMLFMISLSMLMAGWVKTSFFPQPEQPFLLLDVKYPEGSPYKYTTDTAEHIRKQIELLRNDQALLDKNKGEPFVRISSSNLWDHNIHFFIGLTPSETRALGSAEVRNKLKELIGPIPEAQSFSLISSFGGGAPDIMLNLTMDSPYLSDQMAAVQQVTKTLAAYEGVENVRSNLDSGRTEVEIQAKPYAQTLGISTRDIATQVRQAFFGEEIQRIPRAKEDVRVMLRFPKEQRRSLDTLDDMYIRVDSGAEVPLEAVADIHLVPSASTIRRTDRVRNISITADVVEGFSATEIVESMNTEHGANWRQQHPGLDLNADGNTRAQAEFGATFRKNFLLAFVIAYALFAIAYKSIFEPFLVVLAVPFGFMGSIFGHLLIGHNISMMSFFGFLACAGVVVNDNLVLMERINQLREKGLNAFDAALNAGSNRFRPIVLTSLTTFVGLLPIMFETSTQSQFLIPMVLSLAFGVLFSSFVTLFMVPCAYLAGCRIAYRVRDTYLVVLARLGLAE